MSDCACCVVVNVGSSVVWWWGSECVVHVVRGCEWDLWSEVHFICEDWAGCGVECGVL